MTITPQQLIALLPLLIVGLTVVCDALHCVADAIATRCRCRSSDRPPHLVSLWLHLAGGAMDVTR